MPPILPSPALHHRDTYIGALQLAPGGGAGRSFREPPGSGEVLNGDRRSAATDADARIRSEALRPNRDLRDLAGAAARRPSRLSGNAFAAVGADYEQRLVRTRRR